jgi:hypothetical protein
MSDPSEPNSLRTLNDQSTVPQSEAAPGCLTGGRSA